MEQHLFCFVIKFVNGEIVDISARNVHLTYHISIVCQTKIQLKIHVTKMRINFIDLFDFFRIIIYTHSAKIKLLGRFFVLLE